MAHDSELSGRDLGRRFAPTEDRSTQPGPDAAQQQPSVDPALPDAQSSPGQPALTFPERAPTESPSASGSPQAGPAYTPAQGGVGAPGAPVATMPVGSPAANQGGRTNEADAAPADSIPTTPSTASGAPPAAAQATPDEGASGDVALVERAQAASFQHRWSDVQAGFEDNPQQAVSAADALVAELMQYLAASFAGHKTRLEAQWNRGSDTETEELRVALQRYRSFFHRLLAT